MVTSRQIDTLKQDVSKIIYQEEVKHMRNFLMPTYLNSEQILELGDYLERLRPIGKVVNLTAPGNDYRYVSRMNSQKVPVSASFHIRYFEM